MRCAPPPMLGVQPSTYPTLSHYYPTHLPIRQTISTYCAATTRLILFDYDGTLTPIRQRPEDAVPSMEMLKAMEVLVSDPKNSVFVISGRDRGFLETWLGHIKGLGLSAEVKKKHEKV